MRIPLQVYEYAGGLRVVAQFILRSKELNLFMPIQAIVDTGSPVTMIGNLDLARARLSKIQLRKLIGENKPVNIGGGKVITRILEEANIKFGGDLEAEIPVQFPISGEERNNQPSLLGVDFMLKTKSKLVFDPFKKEAYFEIGD
mgnify:CR=1 FL=1